MIIIGWRVGMCVCNVYDDGVIDLCILRACVCVYIYTHTYNPCGMGWKKWPLRFQIDGRDGAGAMQSRR